MFEFSIKSTKNVSEFSIKFEDGEVLSNTIPEPKKPPNESAEGIEEIFKRMKAALDKIPDEEFRETYERASKDFDPISPEKSRAIDEFYASEVLNFDDLDNNKINKSVIQKPEVPDVSVNVADELHNLDI